MCVGKLRAEGHRFGSHPEGDGADQEDVEEHAVVNVEQQRAGDDRACEVDGSRSANARDGP
jgi:hypothetical protein